MTVIKSLFLFVFTAGMLAAQVPSISAVVNAASNIPAGLPNSAIAQGAMFVVTGSTLGPSSLAIASSFPLQTALAGTSVQISVAGITVNGIMYYTLNSQLAAILPSTTPIGSGTVQVIFNGRTSSPVPITVTRNNIGLYTVNQMGSGRAVVTLSDYSYITPTHSANPSEIVTFWANGLGPVAFSETAPALGGDMPAVPLQVFIGGQPANVLYRGRSTCCSSLDQINVQIPQGVGGCVTSVTMQIGSVVSNTTTIPIAVTGRTCAPTAPTILMSDAQRALSQGTLSTGAVTLFRTTTTTISGVVGQPGTATTLTSDIASASFVRTTYSGSPFVNSLGVDFLGDIPSYGSCVVEIDTGQPLPLLGAGLAFQVLNPGSVNISGAGGTKTLTKLSSGTFVGQLAPGFLNPGRFTIAADGGVSADGKNNVGAFNTQVTVPPLLTWPLQSTINSVDRSSGVTVSWTGGDPQGYIAIDGSDYASPVTGSVGASFHCIAKTTDGHFTVPPEVLLALPASLQSNPFLGTLALTAYGAPVRFQAPGLDYGVASASLTISTEVAYK
jgi:uncharacterized protein (TIGR03437 family)